MSFLPSPVIYLILRNMLVNLKELASIILEFGFSDIIIQTK